MMIVYIYFFLLFPLQRNAMATRAVKASRGAVTCLTCPSFFFFLLLRRFATPLCSSLLLLPSVYPALYPLLSFSISSSSLFLLLLLLVGSISGSAASLCCCCCPRSNMASRVCACAQKSIDTYFRTNSSTDPFVYLLFYFHF